MGIRIFLTVKTEKFAVKTEKLAAQATKTVSPIL